MTSSEPKRPSGPPVLRRLTLGLQAIVFVGFALSIYEQQWLNATATAGILFLTFLPRIFSRRFEIEIPAEFELVTIAFIFAALFLGETRGYYGRFWWWDIALHATSGGLLGIFGVLLLYLLNETPRVDLQLRPGFVAFFGFCFAVTMGASWELFEFAMDQLFGLNMQKPMLGDPSGLTDTMWDLLVDALGASLVVLVGYLFAKRRSGSLVERWVLRFIEANPRIFEVPQESGGPDRDARPSSTHEKRAGAPESTP